MTELRLGLVFSGVHKKTSPCIVLKGILEYRTVVSPLCIPVQANSLLNEDITEQKR